MSCTDGDGNGPMSGILDRMISISRDINIDIPIKCSKYSCICNNCGLPPQPDKCVFMIDEKEQFPDLDSPSLIGKLYEMGMNHFNRKQRDNESTSSFILKYIASLEGRYIEESFPDLDSSCGE